MIMETLQQVEFAYNRQRGEARYTTFTHRGVPPRYPPYTMELPVLLLPWDADRRGVLCFLHPGHQHLLTTPEQTLDESANIGVCRCGVVKYGKYFQRQRTGTGSGSSIPLPGVFDVAVKIMDKRQLQLQRDDVFNEVRVMAQLQPPGFRGVYSSRHISQWECSADATNEYIAMDFAANGSLLLFAKRRLTDYKKFAVTTLVQTMPTSLTQLESVVNTFVARAWTLEALHIFYSLIQGLAYVHAKRVCHLDIDPCNVVLDATATARLIDFGSSEVMDANGIAGATSDRLIKFKPLYVAHEVRQHNAHATPRPGFLGAPADMWSAGVLLYQLLCFGYPKGHLALVYDTNWLSHVLFHANGCVGDTPCLGQAGCLICFRAIAFPPAVYAIFRGLLIVDAPTERLTALEVAAMLEPLLVDYEPDFQTRAQIVLESL